MEKQPNFRIGSTQVGEGCPVFIVAEMSGNHGGSIQKAKDLIHAAKAVGANAIKLQTYRPDTITMDSDNPDFQIPSSNPWAQSKSLYSLYEKAFTPWEWHPELFSLARSIGLEVFSSPFDSTAVDFLESLSVPCYKIASPEITDIPLITKIAKTGKPVILSTGVAAQDDIDLAVSTLRNEGCNRFILLKCTAAYPTPAEAMNLRSLQYLGSHYNCLMGLSDHSLGISAPIAATALGAVFIEKHFVQDRSDKSEDAFFSLDTKEFKDMVDQVRFVEKALGTSEYVVTEEMKKNWWGRRSLYVDTNIPAGAPLTEKNIRSVRPGFGLHPRHYFSVLGRKTRRALKKGDRLRLEDLS